MLSGMKVPGDITCSVTNARVTPTSPIERSVEGKNGLSNMVFSKSAPAACGWRISVSGSGKSKTGLGPESPQPSRSPRRHISIQVGPLHDNPPSCLLTHPFQTQPRPLAVNSVNVLVSFGRGTLYAYCMFPHWRCVRSRSTNGIVSLLIRCLVVKLQATAEAYRHAPITSPCA